MAYSVISVSPSSPYSLLQQHSPSCSQAFFHKQSLLSWSACCKTSDFNSLTNFGSTIKKHSSTLIQAAWTRRSSGQPAPKKNKKSWGQRIDKYMRPFILDIFISRRYVSAKVMHRVTGKVVSVVSTNSKDLRNSLPCLIDVHACETVGKVIAERSKDADVFALTYEPRKHEKVEGKLAIILETITANDIAII